MTAVRWATDEELRELVAALREGTLSAGQAARLNDSLANSPSAREVVARYTLLHAMLEMAMSTARQERAKDGQPAVSSPASPAAGCTPSGLPVIVVADPFVPIPAFSLRSPVGGWLFSYAASVLLVGAGLLITSAWKVSSGNPEVVRSSSPVAPTVNVPEPEPQLVGWISSTAGCRWGNQQAARVGATVSLGSEYCLAAGLMEVTYQNGAKVILQGPCIYEVESAAGGFLSFGKLTARVEIKGEGGRGKAEEAENPNSEIRNPKSPFPLSPSPFVVRTPTAIVTDLGTEFGVEVDRSGATQTHVFRGRIELRPAAGKSLPSPVGREAGSERVIYLGADESARVALDQDRVARVSRGGIPTGHFPRRMPESVPIKLFNTGVGLDEGQPDPHWQLIARSDDPHFKPHAAVVAVVSKAPAGMWLANEPAHSQWISMSDDSVWAPDDVTYTFRTTFELADAIVETAAVQGWFIADDEVTAIRMNGKEISPPKRVDADLPFREFTPFSIKRDFVEGVNTLEIDVRNVGEGGGGKTTSPMGLRVELRGFVLAGSRTPPADSGPNTRATK